jgi:hypothetical protein
MRNTIRSLLLLMPFAGGLGATALLAQDDHTPRGLTEVTTPRDGRHGGWANIGLGVGQETFDINGDGIPQADWLARPTLILRAGGTVSPEFRLGGEGFLWFNSEGNVSQTLSALMAVGQLYPGAGSPLFFKGGGGFGYNYFGDDYYGYSYSGDFGFVWNVGAGIEIPVGRQVKLVPTVDYYKFSFDGRSYPNYNEEVVNFGLAIQFN